MIWRSRYLGSHGFHIDAELFFFDIYNDERLHLGHARNCDDSLQEEVAEHHRGFERRPGEEIEGISVGIQRIWDRKLMEIRR